MFKTVSEIHSKTGKNRVYLFADMVICGFKYSAGYSDYKLCEFYNLNSEQRATYITRGINNRVVSLLNNPEFRYIFEDKKIFLETFKDYIKRDWLCLEDTSLKEFKEFLKKHDSMIIKPLDESCGHGIQKLFRKDFSSDEELFDYIIKSGSKLVEEYVIQHPDISNIYPYSVNTYRIVTCLTDDESHVLYAFIRIGNGGSVVDNINAGGMAAPIGIETGIITYPGYDKDGNTYDVHPMTQTKIVGYKLPYWQESVELCLKAAHVVKEVGYVGWDVTVTENGPQLIEGNPFPGHDILGLPAHTPNKISLLPRYKQFIKELR